MIIDKIFQKFSKIFLFRIQTQLDIYIRHYEIVKLFPVIEMPTIDLFTCNN